MRGSCLCGAVQYRVTGEIRPVVACHCTRCRKSAGRFAAATPAPRETVTIEGSVTWNRSSPEAQRGFCPVCGSRLFRNGHASVDPCRHARRRDRAGAGGAYLLRRQGRLLRDRRRAALRGRRRPRPRQPEQGVTA